MVGIRVRRLTACAFGIAVVGVGPVAAQVDPVRAERYFGEARELCERDGGRLWGVSLCGPMVFADPATRTIATNGPAPAAERPPTLGYVNAPIQWGGERWSAYVWPMIPTGNAQARGRLLIHELFHRVQPQLGLLIGGLDNDHLDTSDGRYWLQLEWRALAHALQSTGDTRASAIADALAFRAARRTRFPDASERERGDELREGMAQYTGTVLSASTYEAAVADAISQLDSSAREPTFVHTFAYPSGSAYGLLLDVYAPGWTRRLRPSDDIGNLLAAASSVTPTTDAAAAAERYGGPELRVAEDRREIQHAERIAELRRRFVDGPVLIVPRGSNAMLRTTGATPIPGQGTVYFEYRVTAAWGSLQSAGILVSADNETLRLAAPFRTNGNTLTGDGWTVRLADGWLVEPAGRAGDFRVVPNR